jgi:hypothetical protein
MRIYFERSGGFLGTTLSTTVDTSTLPPEEANQLGELLQDTNFFELPPVLAQEKGADQLSYRLTVETATQSHTVVTTDMDAPDELQPLLRQLTLLARRDARQSADL